MNFGKGSRTLGDSGSSGGKAEMSLCRLGIRLATRAALMLGMCVVGAVALLTLVYCIPTGKIRDNVSTIVKTYEREGVHAFWDGRSKFADLDNWSSILMLEEAFLPPVKGPLRAAMINDRVKSTDGKGQSLIKGFNLCFQPSVQLDAIPRLSYGRYWNGYLVWLKPALRLMTPSDIRIVSMFVILLLLFWVSVAAYRRLGIMECVFLCGAIFILNPISAALCLNYMSVFCISLVAVSTVLCYWEWLSEKMRFPLFFFLVGCLTSFADLLTFPLAALALPVATFAILSADRGWKSVASVGFMQFMAGAGYALMWASKWIVGTVLTGTNIVADGLSRSAMRFSGEVPGKGYVSIFQALRNNIAVFQSHPLKLVLVALLVLSFCWFASNMVRFDRRRIPAAIGLVLLAFLPIVWIAIVRQHSFIHAFMVHKIFSVTVFCLLAIPFVLCPRDRQAQVLEEKQEVRTPKTRAS